MSLLRHSRDALVVMDEAKISLWNGYEALVFVSLIEKKKKRIVFLKQSARVKINWID